MLCMWKVWRLILVKTLYDYLNSHFHTRECPRIVIITIQITSNWLPFPLDFSPKWQLLRQEVFSFMISATRAMNWAQNSFLTRALKTENLCTWWQMVFRFPLSQGQGIHCTHISSKRAVHFLLLITKITSKRDTTKLPCSARQAEYAATNKKVFATLHSELLKASWKHLTEYKCSTSSCFLVHALDYFSIFY